MCPEGAIWTSALATAKFLADQRAGGAAYVIGEAGLTSALHEVGFVLTERDPDYVVLGETRTYSFEGITRAIRLIERGARFIATNPDATGPSAEGSLPATGSVAALITQATGVRPYFVGKPNPLMMRSALNAIDAHSETTVMIGDRMDTDVISGHRGRSADHPGADRLDPGRRGRPLPLPSDPGLRVDRGRRPAGRRVQPGPGSRRATLADQVVDQAAGTPTTCARDGTGVGQSWTDQPPGASSSQVPPADSSPGRPTGRPRRARRSPSRSGQGGHPGMSTSTVVVPAGRAAKLVTTIASRVGPPDRVRPQPQVAAQALQSAAGRGLGAEQAGGQGRPSTRAGLQLRATGRAEVVRDGRRTRVGDRRVGRGVQPGPASRVRIRQASEVKVLEA